MNGVTVVDIEVAEMGGGGSGGDVGKLFESQGLHTRALVWWCTGPTRAVVFPLPIAIILLVPLMRIDVHTMANVGGRYALLDMLHAEPDLSAMLLANLKAHIAGGVIEASGTSRGWVVG